MTQLLSVCWPGPPMAARPTSRAQVKRLQDALVATGAGVDLSGNLRHFFAPGMYGRELAIPGGMVVVGKIHRHQHFTFLLSGEATINTDRGMERITGPHVWVSQEGAKRALMTHTDCVFFTVHLNPDDTTDLTVIEARTIEPEAIGYEAPELDFTDDLQRAYA
jgi:hypothetical protein